MENDRSPVQFVAAILRINQKTMRFMGYIRNKKTLPSSLLIRLDSVD